MRILIQNIASVEWLGGAHYLNSLIQSVRLHEPEHQFIVYGPFE